MVILKEMLGKLVECYLDDLIARMWQRKDNLEHLSGLTNLGGINKKSTHSDALLSCFGQIHGVSSSDIGE